MAKLTMLVVVVVQECFILFVFRLRLHRIPCYYIPSIPATSKSTVANEFLSLRHVESMALACTNNAVPFGSVHFVYLILILPCRICT